MESITRTPPAGAAVHWNFDRMGRLVTMVDGQGKVDYRYDKQGRLSEVAREGEAAIRYQYDASGRVSRMEVGDFHWIGYRYDYLGRLSVMETPVGSITYQYNAGLGRVRRTLPNGIVSSWTHEADGGIKEILHYKEIKGEPDKIEVLAGFQYQHGPDGKITAIAEQTGQRKVTRNYEYDTMGHLVRAVDTGGMTYSYAYDKVGNRTKATITGRPDQDCAYDWAGRLASVNGMPCAHDADGNLTRITLDDITREFRYHPDGRLAWAKNGTDEALYAYDGNGYLVSRNTNGSETRFIPDPLSPYWQPLVITEKDGRRTVMIWEGEHPLAMLTGKKEEWFLVDHLGSPRSMANSNGEIVVIAGFDPFGTKKASDAVSGLSPGFAGLFVDEMTGMQITTSRAYQPGMGRFAQPDSKKRMPSSGEEDLGVYAYCGSDPLAFVDRDGQAREFAEIQRENRAKLAEMTDRIRAQQSEMRRRHAEMMWRVRDQQAEMTRRQNETMRRIRVQQDDMMRRMREQQERMSTTGQRLLRSSNEFACGYLQLFPTAVALTGVRLGQFALVPAGGIPAAIARGVSNRLENKLVDFASSVDAETGRSWAATGKSCAEVRDLAGNGLFVKDFVQGAGRLDLSAFDNVAETIRDEVVESRIEDIVTKTKVPSAREVMKSLSKHGEFAAGQFLNFVGKGSNWIGSQRGGGQWSDLWRVDSRGRLPLGDTEIQPVGKLGWQRRHDEAAKWHDVQDYVNWNVPSGHEVRVPWGNGEYRYFVSRGNESSTHNDEVFKYAFGHTKELAMTKSPTQSTQWELVKVKSLGHSSMKAVEPSHVGGVYLGGAGGAFTEMGDMRGIQVDSNGNLVLVADNGADTKLPPLRIDDLVTVFRSVYLNGEGPTVTIDPDPKNPEGAAMHIVHSEATADTYVGWVLYQADRLMKGYTLGVDNLTRQDVTSSVPGYQTVVDTMYFGAGDRRQAQKQGNWERFWIVPAETNRFMGTGRELTLFDVPLKVKTQKMKWEGGKLVDDLSGASSAGAAAFTQWFTGNYDAISAECYLEPPKEAGIAEKEVPVFAELRRIALMTAVAEKLRDDGVPMPFWMRDHEVRKVPVDFTTPALEVTRKRQIGNLEKTSRILGGVTLSPDSKSVKTFATPADVAKLKPVERAKVDQEVRVAKELERAVAAAVPPVTVVPLESKPVVSGGKIYQVAAVPGAATLAPNPCRLDESDLIMPLKGGGSISLTRSFNSFFAAKGPWGRGWVLDLPSLQEIRVPVERGSKGVRYQTVLEMTTPHNSLAVRFGRIAKVPELGGNELLVPEQVGPFLGLADGETSYFKGLETRKIIGRDGSRWHFTKGGHLVVMEEGPRATLYERDGQGRVASIIGCFAGKMVGKIALGYDPTSGLMAKATAEDLTTPSSSKQGIDYGYEDGHLVAVSSAEGKVGYAYDGPLVSRVTWTLPGADANPEVVAEYEYDRNGRLLKETGPGGEVDHQLREQDGGLLAEASYRQPAPPQAGGDRSQPAPDTSSVRYDNAMRPVEQTEPDGTRTTWAYQPGGTEARTITPSGAEVRVFDTADGAKRTITNPEGGETEVEMDTAGRPVTIKEDGRTVASQSWNSDGQLGSMRTPDQETQIHYDKSGLPVATETYPADQKPSQRSKTREWRQTIYDADGNPVAVKDGEGTNVEMHYDKEGNLVSARTKRPDGGIEGVDIGRDQDGKVTGLDSSWGKVAYSYDPTDGNMIGMETSRDGATAKVRFEKGLVREITGFDNGVTCYAYHDSGKLEGAVREVTCANGLELKHEYDDSGRLGGIEMGGVRRVKLEYDPEGRAVGYSLEPTDH